MAESFAIMPVSSRLQLFSWLFSGVIGLLLLGTLILLGATLLTIPQIKFEVSAQHLRIHYPFYGRSIPLQALDLERARIVNLAREPELKPTWRSNGVAVPGFGGGWFKLKNKDKALLFLSQQERAVYLPTTEGYVLLMSPQEPERFLKRLQDNFRRNLRR